MIYLIRIKKCYDDFPVQKLFSIRGEGDNFDLLSYVKYIFPVWLIYVCRTTILSDIDVGQYVLMYARHVLHVVQHTLCDATYLSPLWFSGVLLYLVPI